jgi:hypothetical protein
VGQLARRLRGKYIDKRSENLKARLEEVESGKYDTEIDGLMKMDAVEIKDVYSNRNIEAEE